MGQSDSKSKQYEEALAQFSSEEKRQLQLLYEKLAGQQQPKIAADSFLVGIVLYISDLTSF
jgi:hypothetical protein